MMPVSSSADTDPSTNFHERNKDILAAIGSSLFAGKGLTANLVKLG